MTISNVCPHLPPFWRWYVFIVHYCVCCGSYPSTFLVLSCLPQPFLHTSTRVTDAFCCISLIWGLTIHTQVVILVPQAWDTLSHLPLAGPFLYFLQVLVYARIKIRLYDFIYFYLLKGPRFRYCHIGVSMFMSLEMRGHNSQSNRTLSLLSIQGLHWAISFSRSDEELQRNSCVLLAYILSMISPTGSQERSWLSYGADSTQADSWKSITRALLESFWIVFLLVKLLVLKRPYNYSNWSLIVF